MIKIIKQITLIGIIILGDTYCTSSLNHEISGTTFIPPPPPLSLPLQSIQVIIFPIPLTGDPG